MTFVSAMFMECGQATVSLIWIPKKVNQSYLSLNLKSLTTLGVYVEMGTEITGMPEVDTGLNYENFISRIIKIKK